MDAFVIFREFHTREEFEKEAVLLIKSIFLEEVAKKDFFTLVLSGGKTPLPIYRNLAREVLPWDKCFIFWGDERNVNYSDPGSNFGAANDALLSHIDIPVSNIFPIPAGNTSPEISATQYENQIRTFCREHNLPDSIYPSFDLILLGMGTDGHIASLFPESNALEEKHLWITATLAPDGYNIRERITMTLPVLNEAKNVIFLVSSEDKAEVIEAIIDKQISNRYPAGRINPKGRLRWLIYR